MLEEIEKVRKEFDAAIEKCKSSEELEKVRVRYLGRKGSITGLLKAIGKLNAEQRPRFGKMMNELKVQATELLEKKMEELKAAEEEKRIKQEAIDVTLPGRRPLVGKKHILTQTMDEMIEILVSMGFSVEYGPEVETDYYNYEALNFPKDHPARDMHDTFYLSEELLLRTHTSPTQIRVMEKMQPPIRVIMPGKCFRNESIDMSHHIIFHQIEGLYVDENVTFADLKGTLTTFLRNYLGAETKLRFRPDFFPFTEPSADVAVSCFLCKGEGCKVCKHTGWLELLGAGMVDPEVFKAVGYDSERYTGFAWGLGIERMVMMKYGIEDIRLFFENDLRFLEQF